MKPRENQSADNVTAVDLDTVVRFQQFAVPQPLDGAVGAGDLALQDKVISGHKNVLLWRSGVPDDLHGGLCGGQQDELVVKGVCLKVPGFVPQ